MVPKKDIRVQAATLESLLVAAGWTPPEKGRDPVHDFLMDFAKVVDASAVAEVLGRAVEVQRGTGIVHLRMASDLYDDFRRRIEDRSGG